MNHRQEKNEYRKSMFLTDDYLSIVINSKHKNYQTKLRFEDLPVSLALLIDNLGVLFELLKDPQNYDCNLQTGEFTAKFTIFGRGLKPILRTTSIQLQEIIQMDDIFFQIQECAEEILIASNGVCDQKLKNYISMQNQFLFQTNEKLKSNFDISVFGQLEQPPGEQVKMEVRKRSNKKGRSSFVKMEDEDKYSNEESKRSEKRMAIKRKVFSNGDTYEGTFKEYHIHGTGRYDYANGDWYEGEFSYGLKMGKGTHHFVSGHHYVGEFRGNLMHGYGKYYYPNRDRYEGEFCKGKQHGKGTHYYATGTKFEGTFINGKESGEGTIYYANGMVDVGLWEDGIRCK